MWQGCISKAWVNTIAAKWDAHLLFCYRPSRSGTATTTPQKQRKLPSPQRKLLAVKALEAGLTPAEVSEIVSAGNSSVTAWARAFREGGHGGSGQEAHERHDKADL
jgi:transposase